MRFSIITPIFLEPRDVERRLPLFQKCIESIEKQDFDHKQFEHIIVNDGSIVPFDIPDQSWIKLINQPNLQRVTAFNRGLKQVTGDIICFLDSDDAYEPFYLSKVHSYFKKYKEYKMFNFGVRFTHTDGKESKSEPFRPKELERGHEIFGGGKIVNGSYVFHKKIYEDLGGFPPPFIDEINCDEIGYGEKPRSLYMTSPYDFSAFAQMEFPEIRPYFQVVHPDHPKGLVKELGNPWGQDYYLFYKYTRKYHSKPIDDYLLKVNLKL